ncbi:MAG: 50S ribosomal protein L22 [Chloroflexota bacterium]|nr:50S ribosomal protein L22 [Chloroflexota bacterium]
MEARALAKNIPISPQKLQLVVDTVRGKRVEEALNILRFLHTPAARPVAKVIKSAVANAENNYQLAPAKLKITHISVDKGITLKRRRARARGRGNTILKRSAHIQVAVEEV